MSNFANSGGLWLRKKTGPKSPDMTGKVTIGEDVLEYIKDKLRGGAKEINLDIACWRAMQTPKAKLI